MCTSCGRGHHGSSTGEDPGTLLCSHSPFQVKIFHGDSIQIERMLSQRENTFSKYENPLTPSCHLTFFSLSERHREGRMDTMWVAILWSNPSSLGGGSTRLGGLRSFSVATTYWDKQLAGTGGKDRLFGDTLRFLLAQSNFRQFLTIKGQRLYKMAGKDQWLQK